MNADEVNADEGGLPCELICDQLPRPQRLRLTLPAGATVADALQAARQHWGGAAVDWDHARIGIWGVEVGREQPLRAGDRVELYRELPEDPRNARRDRVRRAARGRR